MTQAKQQETLTTNIEIEGHQSETSLRLQADLNENQIEVPVPIKFLIQLALCGNIGDGKVPEEISAWAQTICEREQLYSSVTENLHWQLATLKSTLLKIAGANHGIYKDQVASMIDNFALETRNELEGSFNDPNQSFIPDRARISDQMVSLESTTSEYNLNS